MKVLGVPESTGGIKHIFYHYYLVRAAEVPK